VKQRIAKARCSELDQVEYLPLLVRRDVLRDRFLEPRSE